MTGKGELVKYTRLVEEGPLTDKKKERLKKKINAIIDAASNTITVEAMVEPSLEDLKKAVEKAEREKRGR